MPAARESKHAHGRSEIHEREHVTRAAAAARKRLGERLRDLRAAQKLKQDDAAEAIGISTEHLSRIESGHANVTITTIVAITLAYRVSLADLFAEASAR